MDTFPVLSILVGVPVLIGCFISAAEPGWRLFTAIVLIGGLALLMLH